MSCFEDLFDDAVRRLDGHGTRLIGQQGTKKGRRDVRERIRVGREEDARTGRADPTRAFDNLGGTVEGNGTLSAARAALHQGRLRSIKVEIDQGLLPRAELQQEAWKIAGLESEEVFD